MKTYEIPHELAANSPFSQLESHGNTKDEIIIESEFDVQNSNLCIEVGKESFRTKFQLEKNEDQKNLTREWKNHIKEYDDVLEFAKRMDARWNELKESFVKKVTKITC